MGGVHERVLEFIWQCVSRPYSMHAAVELCVSSVTRCPGGSWVLQHHPTDQTDQGEDRGEGLQGHAGIYRIYLHTNRYCFNLKGVCCFTQRFHNHTQSLQPLLKRISYLYYDKIQIQSNRTIILIFLNHILFIVHLAFLIRTVGNIAILTICTHNTQTHIHHYGVSAMPCSHFFLLVISPFCASLKRALLYTRLLSPFFYFSGWLHSLI